MVALCHLWLQIRQNWLGKYPLGAKLLNDDRVLLSADFEWMREIGEMGLMGLLLIIFRTTLAIKMSFNSYRKLVYGNLLPWLIMSVAFLTVIQGQWHQPTALGFCALIGGLWIASFKNKDTEINSLPISLPKKKAYGLKISLV